jgi:hypothetical protein
MRPVTSSGRVTARVLAISRRPTSRARADFCVSTSTASPADPRNWTPHRSITRAVGDCSSWVSSEARRTGAVKVSTSPTTVTVTVPSSPIDVDSVITSSKGASFWSAGADASLVPSAGDSEEVTDCSSFS